MYLREYRYPSFCDPVLGGENLHVRYNREGGGWL